MAERPHGLTSADVGKRVRVTRTWETELDDIEPAALKLSRGGWVDLDLGPGFTITVEIIRPALPTGLGAVVRLDGPDGPCVVRGATNEDAQPWYGLTSGWLRGKHVTDRLHEVLSEGVQVPA